MSEQHVETRRAPRLGDDTKQADKLRAQLAEQNDEIPQGSSPEGAAFSSALRNAVTDIRTERQRVGDDVNFEAQFRNKLSSLAVPGALEHSLLPLSHLGKSAAFVPIIHGPEVAARIEKFLQQELKLDRKAVGRLVKPSLFSSRKSESDGLTTVLPVTEQASPWLQQIIKDNSEIQGAHVGLALLKRKDTLQIGLLVSLEAPERSQVGQRKELAIRDSQGARALSSLGEAVGPLIGIAQNISETLQIVYLGATAKRRGLIDESPGLHALAWVQRVVAYYTAILEGISRLTGADSGLTMLGSYLLLVAGTSLLSVLYERGREKWQSSSAKRIKDEKKK